jgi:NitT/TauT family transport system substrate-binding protein
MKPKYLVWALALLLVAGISLYSVKRRQPQQLKPVRIGYIPIADSGQLFLANNGEFQRRGLRVELVSMAGGAKILEALAAGSIDVGFSNVTSLMLARQAGFSFKAITGGPVEDAEHREHALLVLNNSPIRSVADLRGKRIAINTRKNIDELRVMQLLEMNHLSLDSVSLQEVPFPQMLSVLQGGQVDAIAEIEPFVTAALMSGQTRVIAYTYVDVTPRTETSAYVADERWLKSNPALAEQFIQSIQAVTPAANTDMPALKAALRQYTTLSPEILDRVSYPAYSGTLAEEKLQEQKTLIEKAGWTKITFDPKDLIYR